MKENNTEIKTSNATFTADQIESVVEVCWFLDGRKSREAEPIAKACGLTEEQVDAIRKSPKYRARVEKWMHGQYQAPEGYFNFEKWLRRYQYNEGCQDDSSMSCVFGKRMGLEPKDIPDMVERVRKNIKNGVQPQRFPKDDPYKNQPLYPWAERVKLRDGHVCRRCGSDSNLQAHHILPQDNYGFLAKVPENGITLCETCHTSLKGKEIRTPMLVFLIADAEIDAQLERLEAYIRTHFSDLPVFVKLEIEVSA